MRWAIAVACLLAGCSEPATQLVVVVRSDITELTQTRIRVYDLGEPEHTRGEQCAPFETPGISFGVVPRKNDPSRRIRIEVCGYPASAAPCGAAGADPPLVCQTARTGFIEGRSLRLDMFLARACATTTCPEDQTCIDGACASDEIPPSRLPPARPGAELAVDAGVPDAPSPMCLGETCAIEAAPGASHACALLRGGRVRCWGDGSRGELGNGGAGSSLVPVEVSGLVDAVGLSSRYGHACALRSGGGVACWGPGNNGVLGRGTTADSPVPVDAVGVGDAVAVSVSGNHSCAVRESGAVACWGWNFCGELGTGDTEPRSVATDIAGLDAVVQVAAGACFTCARRRDGTVLCWGRGSDGQLGNGARLDSFVPVRVTGIGDATDLSAGVGHSCVTHTSGGVSCWGGSDRLGDGTREYSDVPVAAIGITDAVSVSVGYNNACALRAGGGVFCWGRNPAGEIGDGTTMDRVAPVVVSGVSDAVFVSISAWPGRAGGGQTACAVRRAGGVLCWGSNDRGQLGDGTMINSAVPVPVTGIP